METTKLLTRCTEIQGFWNRRNVKFKERYKVLRLENDLYQENMESVISNDPRTTYDLARHLLVSSKVVHKIPSIGLGKPQAIATAELSRIWTKFWFNLDLQYRRAGHQSWLWDFSSHMLSTGWYSVFWYVDKTGPHAEVWNPAEVFPNFTSDGLTELVHTYSLSASQAIAKCKVNGWSPAGLPNSGKVTVRTYYCLDDTGYPNCAVLMNEVNQVKPLARIPQNELHYMGIPVLCSPVGGLPDTGVLSPDLWQDNYGESIVTVNESLHKNYSKMLTFQQQIVRDTANPRWLETSRKNIIKPEDLYKRGAVFRAQPGEKVEALGIPSIPIELRTIMFDYQNMLQRGEFPYPMYGNIQSAMPGYMISQIASASMGKIAHFQDAIRFVLTELDNLWLGEIQNGNKPDKFTMPDNLPDDPYFDVNYDVDIPGSLAQRISMARMVNPNFRLSYDTIANLIFHEIPDPTVEQGRVVAEDAEVSPIGVMGTMIQTYDLRAREFKEAGDPQTAQIYERLSAAVQHQLDGTNPAQRQSIQPVGLGRGTLPPEALEGNII